MNDGIARGVKRSFIGIAAHDAQQAAIEVSQ